jgi:hypothetical protein
MITQLSMNLAFVIVLRRKLWVTEVIPDEQAEGADQYKNDPGKGERKP